MSEKEREKKKKTDLNVESSVNDSSGKRAYLKNQAHTLLSDVVLSIVTNILESVCPTHEQQHLFQP